MIVIDSLLVGGIQWVLGKVAAAVDAELNDDTALREALLDAQMRLELGEIDEAQFTEIEADLLARIREIRERQTGSSDPATGVTVTGVEARLEHEDGS